MPPQSPQGSTLDWVADRALRGLINHTMRLPYAKRVPRMGAILRRAIGPLAGYRKRARAQLAMIYPDLPVDDVARIADGVCDNFGRTLIENYSHVDLHANLGQTPAEGAGLDDLAQATQDARPVIFVTGHFGNHEAPRHVLTRLGYDIGGLYRPMANPYFNAHYAQTMTSWGGPVFAQGKQGTIGFAKHLKRGGMGTLLFDVNNDQGTPIPFLGRPAMTATSAADLALKFDALVLPYFGIRQDDGLSFRIVIEAPVPHSDPVTMMTQMNARLAAHVTAHPDQWFWVHKRWKNKQGRI